MIYDSVLLSFVKTSFGVKSTLDADADFLDKDLVKRMTIACVDLYREAKVFANNESGEKEVGYVLMESSKQMLQVLFQTCLKFGIFSDTEITAFGLGDITPYESETVLTFLSTKKKWQAVYDRLAIS